MRLFSSVIKHSKWSERGDSLVSIWCLYTAEICSIQVPMVKIRPIVKHIDPLILHCFNDMLLKTRDV
jgi:hypothetical protein